MSSSLPVQVAPVGPVGPVVFCWPVFQSCTTLVAIYAGGDAEARVPAIPAWEHEFVLPFASLSTAHNSAGFQGSGRRAVELID